MDGLFTYMGGLRGQSGGIYSSPMDGLGNDQKVTIEPSTEFDVFATQNELVLIHPGASRK